MEEGIDDNVSESNPQGNVSSPELHAQVSYDATLRYTNLLTHSAITIRWTTALQ